MLDAYLARANYYLTRDIPNYESARSDAELASVISPSPYAYIYLAQALTWVWERMKKRSKRPGRPTNSISPIWKPIWYWRRPYIANEDFDSALAPLNTIALYDPQNSEANALLAEINFEQGNYQEVIDYATRAIQKNRQDGKAYFLRGRSYMELEEYKKAYDDLRLAQGYQPFVPETQPLAWDRSA